MAKKNRGIIAALCLILSIFISVTVNAVDAPVVSTTVNEIQSSDYGLVDDIQDGQILQLWNWSFKNATANMEKIAEQGFSAIQTSPIQQAKEGTTNKSFGTHWWVYYQPCWFHIDNTGKSALGNKEDFTEMCDEAEKYGIKVIVDAVLNHTGDNGGCNISPAVDPDIKNDRSVWHDISKNTSNWSDRYDITQHNMGGLPDLNTSHSKIQNKAIDFLKECIDAGADGFRYDGAKHIEVPNEPGGSDFWPNVIGTVDAYAANKGVDLYHYGEILDKTGGNGQATINKYTKYMSVTVNTVSDCIRNAVNNRDVNSAKRVDLSFADGAQPTGTKAVLWNESHDTFAHGGSNSQSTNVANKTWSIVGARGEAAGLYLARPQNLSQSLGTASITGWASPEVAAINKLNNHFAGQPDYISSKDSCIMIERGTAGAIITNISGNNGYVNMKANRIANGTYTDQISGNKFKVSNGQISGQIGSSGIAAIYNPDGGETPTPPVNPGTIKLKFTNNLNWNNVRAYFFNSNGDCTSCWPGDSMDFLENNQYGENVYIINVPDNATHVVFNGSNDQTVDLDLGVEGYWLDGTQSYGKYNAKAW